MPKRKHCLLIVDDEPNVCDSVHDLLRRDFRVLKAHSAEEGYRLMQQEEVHIVMSDQRMPQISGVELLTKVKTRYPQAIRMLFTGFADLESVITAINQGHVFQFLRKPWQPEELLHGGPAGGRRIRPAGDGSPASANSLIEEINGLKNRLSSLESEVHRLQDDHADDTDRTQWSQRQSCPRNRPTCPLVRTNAKNTQDWANYGKTDSIPARDRTILNHNRLPKTV